MADRNPEQENLFKEIDEDLRQQKYADLWKKYNKLLIGILIAMVAGVGSYKGWESYQLNLKYEESNLFSSAIKSIEASNLDVAQSILNNIKGASNSGYSILTKFNRASILSQKGYKNEAARLYLDLSQDKNIEKIYRDIAIILHALNSSKSDRIALSLTKLELLINSGSSFRYTAKELSAMLLYEMGSIEKALALYQELIDDKTAPNGTRERASEMSSVIGN
ncbi:MAG: hypothetical protein CMM67_06750 [Rhodospirillaceae bacterium]|nr:hypothetical protein [Rhodospirillaceae bacterium]OUT78288.1 MAG: hypothetical protein CBB83_06935 [Rhodospirillaceae bacterium TMED23]|tara:strand:- start:62 stop:727 length:666 start_codon:yes stop_codon:yes gene_type:complete